MTLHQKDGDNLRLYSERELRNCFCISLLRQCNTSKNSYGWDLYFIPTKTNRTPALAMGCTHCFFTGTCLFRSEFRQAGVGEETAFVPQACKRKENLQNR